jgi:hypothetical protein
MDTVVQFGGILFIYGVADPNDEKLGCRVDAHRAEVGLDAMVMAVGVSNKLGEGFMKVEFSIVAESHASGNLPDMLKRCAYHSATWGQLERVFPEPGIFRQLELRKYGVGRLLGAFEIARKEGGWILKELGDQRGSGCGGIADGSGGDSRDMDKIICIKKPPLL